MLLSFELEDALKILHADGTDVSPSECIESFDKNVATALCDVVNAKLENLPALLLAAEENEEKTKLLRQLAIAARDLRKYYEIVYKNGLAMCIMVQKDSSNSSISPSAAKIAPLLGYINAGKANEKRIEEGNKHVLEILCLFEALLAPYLPDEPDSEPSNEKRTTRSCNDILNEVLTAADSNAKGTISNINAAAGAASSNATGTTSPAAGATTGSVAGATTSPATRAASGSAAGTTTSSAAGAASSPAAGATTSPAAGTTTSPAAGAASGSAAGAASSPAADATTSPATGATASPAAGAVSGNATGATASPAGADTVHSASAEHPASSSDQASGSDGKEQSVAAGDEVDAPKRKRGGVPGHDGTNRVYNDTIHETEINLAEHCKSCSEYESCLARAATKDRKIELELHHEVRAKAYEIGVVKCPKTGEIVEGTHPESVRGRTFFGPHFIAMVLTLFCQGFVSISRIAEIIKECFGIKISTGTVSNFIHRAGEQGVAYWDYIRLKVREAAEAFSDETSGQIQAAKQAARRWIHTVVTDSFTYLYCSEFRGYKAILADGVLVDFVGYLCHDCWGSYWALNLAKHVLCGAHLVRELWGILTGDPSQTWVADMHALLKEMLAKKRELMQLGLDMGLSKKIDASVAFPQCTPEEIADYKRRYLEIVRRGFEINGVSFEGGKRGNRKQKQTKAVNLLVRLRDYMDAWLAFIIDVRIPFTNNDAETSLRGSKVWQHISHVMGNDEGLVIRCILLSIVQSAKKQGRSAYEALLSVIQGVPPEEFFGQPVSQEIRDSAPSRTDSAMVLRSMKSQETKAAND